MHPWKRISTMASLAILKDYMSRCEVRDVLEYLQSTTERFQTAAHGPGSMRPSHRIDGLMYELAIAIPRSLSG